MYENRRYDQNVQNVSQSPFFNLPQHVVNPNYGPIPPQQQQQQQSSFNNPISSISNQEMIKRRQEDQQRKEMEIINQANEMFKGQVELFADKKEKEEIENMAEIYSLLVAADRLEWAFLKDFVSQLEYENQCYILINKFKTLTTMLQKSVLNSNFFFFFWLNLKI